MENQNQNWLGRVKPFIAVVFLQAGFAGMDVLSKAAMKKGMNNYVFVRFAFFIIAPFAYKYISLSSLFCVYMFMSVLKMKSYYPCFKREVRSEMTFSIFMKRVALSVLEPVIAQNLFFLGMKNTTATFATAMSNITPAITFVIA